MPTKYVDLIQQLSDVLPDLSPQQQRAASYLLEHPDDVGLLSMRAIAIEAGVKPATISRLCRTLGFDNYDKFSAPFKQNLRKSEIDYHTRFVDVQRRGAADKQSLYEEVRVNDIANIQSTLADDKFPVFQKAVKTISKSRRVYVLGLRGSYSAAFLFHYAYQLFRDNSQLIDAKAGMFADQLRGINSDDCMYVVSFEPYTRMTIDAVDYAIDAGVKIIAITDKYNSPVAQSAAHTIITCNDSPSFYQSLTGALAVNHALITLLVSEAGEDAVKILKEAEKQLSSISAYW